MKKTQTEKLKNARSDHSNSSHKKETLQSTKSQICTRFYLNREIQTPVNSKLMQQNTLVYKQKIRLSKIFMF
jgi:hypothetical protein